MQYTQVLKDIIISSLRGRIEERSEYNQVAVAGIQNLHIFLIQTWIHYLTVFLRFLLDICYLLKKKKINNSTRLT
jgi:hypothetical protein